MVGRRLRPTGPYPILLVHGEQAPASQRWSGFSAGSSTPTRPTCGRAAQHARPGDCGQQRVDHGIRQPLLHRALALRCALPTLDGRWIRYAPALHKQRRSNLRLQAPRGPDGIEEIATRGDLIDRCISLELQPIAEAGRKTESEIWAALNASAGGSSARCSTPSHMHCAPPRFAIARAPRMADFAIWATAARPGLACPRCGHGRVPG